jgi:Protein of unknown function (DUF3073)
MGRGRQKAKAAKVARDLKYSSQEIDIERLSAELHGEFSNHEDEGDDDPFAEGNYIRRA